MSAPGVLQERLPRVVIVGRPNVGKSTLLNRLFDSRVSIVEPTAGVTRDRVAVDVRLETREGPRWVELVDTGGIGIVDRDDLSAHVEGQVRTAVESADLVLFMVDAREGLTPLDAEVARRLRGIQAPVLLLANKVEGRGPLWNVDEFRQLGLGEGPFPISAQEGEGLEDVVERVRELLGPALAVVEPRSAPVMKLAVVGQRNAGKSTLINRLAGEERMIVSEIPGTTRDAVDVRFERDGQVFVAIDTAGLRKASSHADAIDFYSDARSHKTVRRADVVLHMFDVSKPLASIDKKLARYAVDHYRPVVLCANKWDLVADFDRQEFIDYIRKELPGLAFAPIRFLSAKTGQGVEQVMRQAEELLRQSRQRVGTGELNRVLKTAVESRSPSSTGARIRILYATQAESAPPTFVVFVNDKKLIGKAYIRYLTNRLREELAFPEVPLHIVLRDRSGDEEESP